MNNPLLSILIPTVVGREDQYKNIFRKIYEQCEKLANYDFKKSYAIMAANPKDAIAHPCWGGIVQVLTEIDNKELTIGEKREILYKKSDGIYSWQIDDDDSISDNAIQLILETIKSNPEIPCITFREKCIINGEYKTSNHSIQYVKWQDNFDGYDYVRTPFYKDVIRTDIAKSVPFEKIRWNEDERWSYAIQPFLLDEIHLEEEIYHYIHNSTNPTERYGLDKL